MFPNPPPRAVLRMSKIEMTDSCLLSFLGTVPDLLVDTLQRMSKTAMLLRYCRVYPSLPLWHVCSLPQHEYVQLVIPVKETCVIRG